MKKGGFVLILITISLLSASGKSYSQDYPNDSIVNASDTIKNIENKVIEEIITKGEAKKEKVEYLSQVTKYGFKNLFNEYSYNAALPYSAQVNPHAEKYMQDYLRSHSAYLTKLRSKATPYFNFIDNILSQYGLPVELKYLAVIESNLKSTALSSAGALGPWQFMDYTARDYGLQVNHWVDERTDYYKSTVAASKYLLNLYKDLKDWLLVIAAYNGGPGRVYSAIRKSGSRDFWKLQYYLPEESRNHVKKFIATHYIMETASMNDHNFPSFNYSGLSAAGEILAPKISDTEKQDVVELELSGRYKASVIARNIEMNIKDFNRYNPGFDPSISSGAAYTLRLPQAKMALFAEKKYEILNECVNELLGNMELNNKTVYGSGKIK